MGRHEDWSNEQTWCVAMLIDNDKILQDQVLEMCENKFFTAETVLRNFCQAIKDKIVNVWPEAWPNGFVEDEVNWAELYEHFKLKAEEGGGGLAY